jgi:hypothetical protein
LVRLRAELDRLAERDQRHLGHEVRHQDHPGAEVDLVDVLQEATDQKLEIVNESISDLAIVEIFTKI